jgi:hypothetical protein
VLVQKQWLGQKWVVLELVRAAVPTLEEGVMCMDPRPRRHPRFPLLGGTWRPPHPAFKLESLRCSST